MADRGAILDATLWLFHAQATNPAPSPNEDFQVGVDTLAAAAKWVFDVTRRARELGVQADLVVLRSDPSKSISHTRDIMLVIKRGRVIER